MVSEPHLSPSIQHRYLREQMRPRLRYAGGPRQEGAATAQWPSVEEWQDQLRPRVRESLGLPFEERPALEPRTWWRQHDDLGTIDKISFTAEPYSEAVGYFCVPHGLEPPYPTVICLQGHSTGMHKSIAREREDETQLMEIEGDRDFALGAMRQGYAALCLEQRSFGYRREQEQAVVSPHGCHDAAMHALMLGRTLVGERVFDIDRGIDYLTERGDVDLERVGVLGNSGGGTATIYAAAVLDRVRFAMPSCAFCTFADSIMSVYHCADNYVPGLLRWAENADVLGLFAPKPVVVVAGRDDQIFPIDGVHEAFADLQAIYSAAGHPDRCRLVVGEGGHRFYAEPGWKELHALLDG